MLFITEKNQAMENINLQIDTNLTEHNFQLKITQKVTIVTVSAKRKLRDRAVPPATNKVEAIAKRKRELDAPKSKPAVDVPISKRRKVTNGQLVVAVRAQQFESKELVVTKVKGWSAWPAQITKINNSSGRKYEVKYFGFTNCSGAVGANEIFKFNDESIEMLHDVAKNKPQLNGFMKSLREVEIQFSYKFPFEILK